MKSVLKKIIGQENIVYLRNVNKDLVRAYKFIKLQLFSKQPAIQSLPSKSLIIEVEDGGLGDHLFHSNIPRIAKESGLYSKIFLSNLSNFRDVRHKEIVWSSNPYLDGFTNSPGTPLRKRLAKENKKNLLKIEIQEGNFLDKVLQLYGLSSKVTFIDPEIYYVPAKRVELQDKVIFDPNWITNLYDESVIKRIILNYFSENNIKVDYAFRCRRGIFINEFPIIEDNNFEDFCDILYSAKSIYCFASGTAVLCSALKIDANVFFTKEMSKIFKFSKKHNYIQID